MNPLIKHKANPLFVNALYHFVTRNMSMFAKYACKYVKGVCIMHMFVCRGTCM